MNYCNCPNCRTDNCPAGEAAAVSSTALLACFAVVHSNYEPMEVDSLWQHRADAENRAYYLGNSWRVRELEIHKHANEKDQR